VFFVVVAINAAELERIDVQGARHLGHGGRREHDHVDVAALSVGVAGLSGE